MNEISQTSIVTAQAANRQLNLVMQWIFMNWTAHFLDWLSVIASRFGDIDSLGQANSSRDVFRSNYCALSKLMQFRAVQVQHVLLFTRLYKPYIISWALWWSQGEVINCNLSIEDFSKVEKSTWEKKKVWTDEPNFDFEKQSIIPLTTKLTNHCSLLRLTRVPFKKISNPPPNMKAILSRLLCKHREAHYARRSSLVVHRKTSVATSRDAGI